MMSTLVRRNITFLFPKNSSYIVKSYYDVYFFSTITSSNKVEKQQQKQPINTNPVHEFLVHKHHFSPEVASHVASAVPILRNQDKSDSILSFLKDVGFTQSQLEKILKSRPILLSSSLENTIKPKIKLFQDFGFSSNDIARIISRQPLTFHYSLRNRLIPGLSLLKGLLGSNAQVVKIVRKCEWLLARDLEKTMMRNIEFLKSYGIAMKQIMVVLNSQPRYLLSRPELVRKHVEMVSGMGVDRSSKMFIYTVFVVGSMAKGKWEIKVQEFRNILGFSEDDILRTVKHNPQAFTASEDKIKKVKEVLLATGKYKVSCMIKFPISVLYSIEKRFTPRFQVFEILESRHIITKWPTLATLCRTTNNEFFEQFVRPYSLDDVYMRKMINQ